MMAAGEFAPDVNASTRLSLKQIANLRKQLRNLRNRAVSQLTCEHFMAMLASNGN